jgi:hypothetical protein
MATFNYTVDTQPMADELKNVSRHVDVTTGAVVAMQTAVIAAERKGADHVCANVNKGFYSLIRSQISQKLAKFKSEVDSQIMQLAQQKKALIAIKTRMERDYNMISKRYMKLFNGLNVNLKNRIFELDKPTMDFACKEVEKASNRTRSLSATFPITQSESISSSQKIVASNIKLKGLNVINSMKGFIHEMNIQKKLTDAILIDDFSILKEGVSYIPIVIYECNRDKTDYLNIEIVVPETELSTVVKSAIKNAGHSEFTKLSWIQNSSNLMEISSEFSKLISVSKKSQRIKDLSIKLFQANKYLTI